MSTYIEPEPIDKFIELSTKDIAFNTVSNHLIDKSNITYSQSGSIFASLPYRDSIGNVDCFVSRYLTAPIYNIDAVKPYMKCCDELVDYVKKRFGTVDPTHDYLHNKHYPAKHSAQRDSEFSNKSKNVTRNFIKREAYSGKINNVRGISNQDKNLVVELNEFTGPLHNYFTKNLNMYMPGKRTIDTSLFVDVIGTDYSFFEASQHLGARYAEVALAKIFSHSPERYLDALAHEFNNQFCMDNRTRSENKLHLRGKQYKVHSLAARLSGSSCTTTGNSWITINLQFAFYRLKKNMSIEEAYNAVRAAYGDDATALKQFVLELCSFVKELGFTMKVEKDPAPGEICYLGKVFKDGEYTLDARRITYRYLISFGNHHHTANLLNKWAGYYNPSKDMDDKINVFKIIGRIAFNILLSKPKLMTSNEETTRLDRRAASAALNSTFDTVFGNDYNSLLTSVLDLENLRDPQQLIDKITDLIEPFIPKILPANKTGNVHVNEHYVCSTPTILKLDDVLSNARNFNVIRSYTEFGGRVKKLDLNKYATSIIELVHTLGITCTYENKGYSGRALLKLMNNFKHEQKQTNRYGLQKTAKTK